MAPEWLLFAQTSPTDEPTKWLAFGCAIAFSLLLLRVLIWYQREFLASARVELSTLRTHVETLGARLDAAEEAELVCRRRVWELEYQAAIVDRQMAAAGLIPDRGQNRTRATDLGPPEMRELLRGEAQRPPDDSDTLGP